MMTALIIALALLSMVIFAVILGIVWGLKVAPPLETRVIIVEADNDEDEDDEGDGGISKDDPPPGNGNDDDGDEPRGPKDGPLVDWDDFDRKWRAADWDKEKV